MFRETRRKVGTEVQLRVVDEDSFSNEVDEEELQDFANQCQQKYLDLLLRGASPAAACSQLNLDLFDVIELMANDDEFRIKTDAVYDALSQNVAAKLYQEAMKGSVPAMSQWLKNRPPPEWPDQGAISNSVPSLGIISDEELIRLARLENLAIPPGLETDDAGESSSRSPEKVP